MSSHSQVSFEKCGHVPAVEKTEEFVAAVTAFLGGAANRHDERGRKTTHPNCLDAERSMESAPEPLIMMARQMTMART